MCDRRSRYCVIVFTRNSKSSSAVQRTIKAVSDEFPAHTVTSDQGVEFSCYKSVEDEYKINFYVCNPHSPWQKGGIENLNGLIREFSPKGTNFRNVPENELQRAMELLNNRPRKCLGWKTPSEVISEVDLSYLNFRTGALPQTPEFIRLGITGIIKDGKHTSACHPLFIFTV